MYCLEKFQRELAYFLDIDLRDLPKVQEILKAQGYTAVKKNDEIIELGNGKISKEQIEKLKEVVESGDKAQNKIQLRQATKEILNTLKNKEITHKNGIVARVSSVGIEKMMSDKAIQKSLDNGFSISQHFNAVQNIETLFKNSDFLRTEAPKNQSKDIVGVHRYINTENLQEQNAQALITLKESVENGNRIYSLELEELTHPTHLNRSPKSKGAEDSHHDDAGATNTARLFENPNADYTTNKVFNQGDSLIYTTIGNGKISKEQIEKLKEVVEKAPPKADDLKVLQINADEAQNILQSVKPEPMPQSISKDEFLNGFEEILNKENFTKHLEKAQDSSNRLKYLNLVEPTLQRYDLALTTLNKNGSQTQEFIKAYQGEDNKIFYVLITPQENNKMLLTGFPTTKWREIKKRIQNANEIKARDLGEISSAQSHTMSPTPREHSTTNKIFNQGEGESYKTITQQEALDLLETLPTTTLPKELDIDTFLKSLENIENKENFIEHLQSKTDAQSRLAYLNLVEPTLRQPQMILEFANKKEYIKSFRDENGKNILNLIITKQDDTMLVTMIPNVKASYLKSEINKADIIRSFIPQGSNKERTTTADYTTNKVFNQGDIKFDSLGDFEYFTRPMALSSFSISIF